MGQVSPLQLHPLTRMGATSPLAIPCHCLSRGPGRHPLHVPRFIYAPELFPDSQVDLLSTQRASCWIGPPGPASHFGQPRASGRATGRAARKQPPARLALQDQGLGLGSFPWLPRLMSVSCPVELCSPLQSTRAPAKG